MSIDMATTPYDGRALGGQKGIMQQQQQQPSKKQATPPSAHSTTLPRRLRVVAKLYPDVVRYINAEEEANNLALLTGFQPLIEGPEDQQIIDQLTRLLHRARHDIDAEIKLNQYIYGGISILNLVLFPVLVTIGRVGFSASIAWIAFAISFPCTVAALFLSGMQGSLKNLKFPLMYSIIGWGALLGSWLATTASIWHYWDLAGQVFAGLSVVLFLVSAFYDAIMRLRKNASIPIPAQAAPTTPAPPVPAAPSATPQGETK